MKISKEVKVALLGIIAVVGLFFGYKFLKGSDLFSSSRTYYAVYDSVDGLTISNPVVLNGVKVGIVKDVKLLPERQNQICITMEIENVIDVGDSTIASLSSSSLLGGKAIELQMGRNTKRYEGGDTLKSYVEKSITDLLSAKAMPLMGSVDSTLIKINSFFDKDAKKSLQATLQNAQASTEAMKNILLMNQRNLNLITGNLSELTYNLKSTQQKFDRMAGNLATVSDSLEKAQIGDMIRSMHHTVAEAETLVKKFNENKGTLGKLMNNDSLYNNLNNTASNMDALMVDLKANPKRYVHFSVFGKSAGSGDTKVKKANMVVTKGSGEVKIKEVNQVDTTGKIPPPAPNK